MTKDDPTILVTSPHHTMEQNAAMLNLNLNEPLTDQLTKHKFMQEEARWREGAIEAKGLTGYGGRLKEYGEEGKRMNFDHGSSEIVDLVLQKNSTDVAPFTSDNSKHGFYGSKADLSSFAAYENYGKHQLNGYEKPTKNSSNLTGASSTVGDGFKDQQKSDRSRSYNYVNNDWSNQSFHVKDSATKPEAAGKGLAPPPPLKKTADGGGQVSAKPGSAFLPVDRQPRELTSGIPAVYKTPGYQFCMLPFQQATSGSVYQPLSHPLLQSSAPDHRLLTKVQSPSAGTPLSPYVLYPDTHMTHQLEVLWQQKYPHHPVPPVWMLYQYMDELLRDTSQLPSAVDRLSGREFFNASSIPNSTPVIPSSVDAISVDRKKDKREVRDKNFVTMETKRADERSKEEFQTRKKTECKDSKDWRAAYESDQQGPEKSKSSPDWYKAGQQKRTEFLPGTQVHQRRELLVDKSASSACDAVNQHFQESLLRLNSQNHSDLNFKDKSRIGRDVRPGNYYDDRALEKQNIYGNGSYQNRKESKRATTVDAKGQNDITHDQARSSNFHPVSHVARKAEKTQPGQISFDIYGYQSQCQRPAYSPERLQNVTRKNSLSSKPDKSTQRNGHQEQSVLHFNHKNPQEHQMRPQSGFPVASPKTEAKDALNNSLNVPSRIPEKQSANVFSAKRMNDVKFSTGNQSVPSPTPGSIVKDSGLGPSRLIAGSPRPLPSFFYNPLDPRMEPVQPYQVNIEPVERWPGASAWTQCPPDWAVPQTLLSLQLNGVTSNGIQRVRANGFPPEAHMKIQQDLIPTPVHFPPVHEAGRGSNGFGYKVKTLESDQNQSISSTSRVADGMESHRISSKRFEGRDDDEPQCLKKSKTNSVAPLSVQNEGSPLGSIDSFKSFVDQAVYNAFLEDSNKRAERTKLSSASPIMKILNLSNAAEPTQQRSTSEHELRCSSASQLRDTQGSTTMTSTMTTSYSALISDQKSNETMVKSSTENSEHWSQVEPCGDTRSTISCDTSASDEQKGDAYTSASSVTSNFSFPPPPLSQVPPSPPRGASGTSLNLKKAWLARYSDNDQKPPSDLAASGTVDKLSNSVGFSKFLSLGESAEDQSGYVLDSAVAKTSEASAASISKLQSEKSSDSNSSSETLVDSNLSRTQNSRITNSKRKLPSELPTKRPKMAKPAANQKTPVMNGLNSRKMRGKSSKMLDDGGAAGEGDQSDSETKPSQMRRKTRVRNTQTLDLKDEDLGVNDPRRKAWEVFLQDDSCVKIAQRLPKCRECKIRQSHKNIPQTTNMCKFMVFRKLCYNSKGVLSVAGFLEPSDEEASDVDLWMPSKSKRTSLSLVQAQYLVTHLKEYFTCLLQEDTSLKCLELAEEDHGSVLWRRPIEGVQETCDACDTVVFDVHWTCTKCGFVACKECHAGQTSLNGAQEESKERDWPPCSDKRQIHEPYDLFLTQIIPHDALSAIMRKFSQSTENARRVIRANDDTGLGGRFLKEAPNDGVQLTSDDLKPEEDQNKTKRNGQTGDRDSDLDVPPRCAQEGVACATKPSGSIAKGTHFTKGRSVSDLTSNGSAAPKIEPDKNICSKLLVAKEENTSNDLDFTPMPLLDFHGQPAIEISDGEEALHVFQRRWSLSLPVIVRNCGTGFSSNIWKPEAFLKRFGHLRLELVNCLNGTVHRFQSMEKLWNGSKNPSSSNKMAGLLQFKDWPLSDDWTGLLSDHNADLNCVLPMSGYTLATGPFNLASHLPEFFPQPDLVTRINVGYGNLAQSHVTLARMQTNHVDFVNIVMSSSSSSEDSRECSATSISQLLKDSGYTDDTSSLTKSPEKIVSIWHIYHPLDSSKIQTFLEKVSGTVSRKGGDQNRGCLSSDIGCYLDADLRDKLLKETSIQATVAVQCLGDAVFVPATAFYQVKVIKESVSVTKEFISPESIASSFTKSTHSSSWSDSKLAINDKQEHLQIKNLVYHTIKDCVASLSETKS